MKKTVKIACLLGLILSLSAEASDRLPNGSWQCSHGGFNGLPAGNFSIISESLGGEDYRFTPESDQGFDMGSVAPGTPPPTALVTLAGRDVTMTIENEQMSNSATGVLTVMPNPRRSEVIYSINGSFAAISKEMAKDVIVVNGMSLDTYKLVDTITQVPFQCSRVVYVRSNAYRGG